jgi:hypothetical protein
MRPVRPPSGARRITRAGGRLRNLERRAAEGGTATTTDWVEFDEPYDNGWEWPGGDAVKPAWKLNPNAGKHPFLRGAAAGGASGSSPFTLPPEAGAPFDGTDIKVSAFTDGSNIAITTTNEDGVITVFTFDFASLDDVDTLTDALAAHLADTNDAHDASAISVTDADGNYTGSTVEAVLAEIADMIASGGSSVPTSRTITAGSGLTGGGDLTANRTLDVNVDGTTIEISSDAVRVKAGGITSSHIADGTITTGDLAFDPATQTELDAHISDSSAAHAASAISASSTTLVGTATDVQGVLEELDNSIADHLADPADAHDGSAISVVPFGTVTADNVQDALEQLLGLIGSGGDPPPGEVTYVAAGTAADVATTPDDLPVPFPAGLALNDLMLAQVVSRNTVSTITAPAGWTLLFGPDTGGGTFRQWIYYKFSDGTETGTVTWQMSGSALFYGRMYAFRGVKLSAFTEGGGLDQNTGTAITCPSVTSSVDGALAVAFISAADDNTIANFTGESGGDYTAPVVDYITTSGLDGMLGIQTAALATATTISGGGCTMSASDPWLVRAFALKPA